MPSSDYTPTIAQVGAILRARTKDSHGNELGTFNDDTRPTAAQVTSLIETAVTDLEDAIGEEIPESLFDNATSAATYRSAMLVELSYFPENVGNNDNSLYARLKELYDEKLKKLGAAVSEGEAGEDFGGAANLPSYGFPAEDDTYPGMVGWGSRF